MSSNSSGLREQVMSRVQGALYLSTAYAGIVNGLFEALADRGPATPRELALAAEVDTAYVVRWCDSAYAFELIDETADGVFSLTDQGTAFRADGPDSLMPLAVQAFLAAHMGERAAELMRTGERPGEQALAERSTLLPLFGPMLEGQFAPLLEREVLERVPAFREVDARGGLAVDLGCGNGWYLRRLAGRYPGLRGIGLDGFEENIRQARELADGEGLSERLDFRAGDLHAFAVDEPVDLIAMNRALHHVWDQKENVFRILRAHLKPGGFAVIWEPHWPLDRSRLREPAMRAMAFQNLVEHVQGNHFLMPREIVEQFQTVGMSAEVYDVADGRDAIVVGRLPL
ncbi:MAG TPA: class I SAM-dependent methyltransferase [Gammaproteobacteria bacterium]|nr:class I SAM-dependent methyltransferase [Gammaproteobacteria bacterium]